MAASRSNTAVNGLFPVSSGQREEDTDYNGIRLSTFRGWNVLPGPPRRAKGAILDVDVILIRAEAHRNFKRHNIAYRNLPEFESLYHSDEMEAQAELQSEIKRLIAAMNQKTADTTPSTSNTPSSTSRKSHESATPAGVLGTVNFGFENVCAEDLLTCIDHLLCNLALVVYKNALLVVQNLRWCHSSPGVHGIFETALNQMHRTRRVLISRLIPHSQFIELNPPPPLQPGTACYDIYDIIVDYISSFLARAIVESADGPAWCDNSLAVLARLSRKLKSLKTSARRYADEAISSTEFLHEDLRDEHTDTGKHIVFHFDGDTYDVVDDSIYLQEYFRDQLRCRSYLCEILDNVLSTIQRGMNDKPSASRQKEFDFNIMCQKEQGNFALLVSSDAHHNISATSDEMAMSLSVTGCRLLRNLVISFSKQKQKPTPYGAGGVLKWWWTDEKLNETAQVHVETVEEAFSTLVALAMTSSTVADSMSALLDFASCLDEDAGEVRAFQPGADLHLAFSFARPTAKIAPVIEKDTISLATFVQQDRFADSRQEEIVDPGASLREQYKHCEVKIGNWTIDSVTITVHRSWVVIGIVVPSILLALAGVTLMLAPYKRPKGVDPSNFMIFLWSIALSFLLVGKAFFVPDWPWHDFLRGNVACRSVSEVARISGIDEQLVIMKLLNDRHGLAVKGPYDTVFGGLLDRQAATTGFSIDVPIDLKTLYASGFLILKVDNYERPRLVLIRGAEQADFDNRTVRSLRIVGDVPLSGRQQSEFGTKIRLSRQGIYWQHVFGLYVNPTAKFV